jgi:hypothetical protein
LSDINSEGNVQNLGYILNGIGWGSTALLPVLRLSLCNTNLFSEIDHYQLFCTGLSPITN